VRGIWDDVLHYSTRSSVNEGDILRCVLSFHLCVLKHQHFIMFKKIFSSSNPEEEAKKWGRTLRSEQRKLELQITKIQREQQKAQVSMKQAAKRNDNVALRMMAKELVASRKAVNRMYTAKAQMNSVAMQLQNQVAQLKMSGTMAKSAEIMKEMNSLMNVPEVQRTMMEMGKEMTKAGLLEDMMNDTLDNAIDEDISDEDVEEEVGKIIAEVTHQQMEGAHAGHSRLPATQQKVAQQASDDDEDELAARLNALKSI